ncbi:neuropeptide CCHamide-2 [Eupeodes corollae]|uniref:neuropeptide CCHamide-2 n=1 Tax=Eupeodes corollae TaxID=290404 RepID=UPI0024924777|nr:neuropeptide CCHamide-2 [Eupeodes corollae]XP_055907530.1 neuropeptide CCHamide-2 [Eupeodes corollae]
MKQSISFFFVLVCTVVLAAHESQAKKGCNAYGHACYGGHGKRSLGQVSDEIRPETILQMFPNEEGSEINTYPRYRLIKIMRQLLGGRTRQQIAADRLNDMDYALSSSEAFKENSLN